MKWMKIGLLAIGWAASWAPGRAVGKAGAAVPEFVILITSYNNEQFVARNLASVLHQKSTHPYRIIYINDCSTDGTAQKVKAYSAIHDAQERITFIDNKKRVGSLANIYTIIHTLIPDEAVVVSVDGDDELASDSVLLRLEAAYADPAIWITYGHYIRRSSGLRGIAGEIPRVLLEYGKLRELHPFLAHHLKTFKAGLFKKISKEDLMHDTEFFSATGDLAFMIPMLEMAAPSSNTSKNHSMYINDVLYIYNDENPINDYKVHRERQKFYQKLIRGKKPYDKITAL